MLFAQKQSSCRPCAINVQAHNHNQAEKEEIKGEVIIFDFIINEN